VRGDSVCNVRGSLSNLRDDDGVRHAVALRRGTIRCGSNRAGTPPYSPAPALDRHGAGLGCPSSTSSIPRKPSGPSARTGGVSSNCGGKRSDNMALTSTERSRARRENLKKEENSPRSKDAYITHLENEVAWLRAALEAQLSSNATLHATLLQRDATLRNGPDATLHATACNEGGAGGSSRSGSPSSHGPLGLETETEKTDLKSATRVATLDATERNGDATLPMQRSAQSIVQRDPPRLPERLSAQDLNAERDRQLLAAADFVRSEEEKTQTQTRKAAP
jgi:hypothetical protein